MKDRIKIVVLYEDEYRRHLEEAATAAVRQALEAYRQANPPASDPPELISKKEAARLLDVSIATLDKLRKDGLKWYRVQSNVRFKRNEVLEYAEKRQR